MVSGLKMRAKRKEIDKAACEHYAYPVWVVVVGNKYQARCLGCETVGPVVNEGPRAARQALRTRRTRAAASTSGMVAGRGTALRAGG